ncbi:MAG: hypothetical protein V1839_00095 [archaeon]
MGTALIIGIAGAVLLICAWLWETYENVKKRKITIHLHFAVIYIFGNVMLAVYSWLISGYIFFWLSVFLLAAITGELLYSALIRKKRR